MGAMSATCQPFSMACSAASAATSVLPLPTSPCNRRRIGCACERSREITATAFFCARVSAKGSDFTSALVRVCFAGNAGAAFARRSR